jgi:hypothetical protein
MLYIHGCARLRIRCAASLVRIQFHKPHQAGPHMSIWGMSTASAPSAVRRNTTCSISFFASSRAMTCGKIRQGQSCESHPLVAELLWQCKAHAACRL